MADAENDLSDEKSESTEEEIEPKFKYQRIANDLKDILNADVVTCCAVHWKFLIFGTYLGRVYVLDHLGNSVSPNLTNFVEYSHSVAVNHIDIDPKGEHIASCSDDGKVFITGLLGSENNQNLSFTKSIKSVTLDPDPKFSGVRRFIIGDENLTLYEKNFIKKLKPSVLFNAEGSVLSVSWNGQFVAWASYLGVRVHDLNEKCSLGLLKWEEPINGRLENFRCNFRWSNENTLLIGWVDRIRICVIRKCNAIEAANRERPGYIVDPISTFNLSFFICGLAPLTDTQLVALGYPKEKDPDHKALRPVLCLVDSKLGEEICTDSLSIRGFQEYTVNDYSLVCLLDEHRYFIVAPKDIVVVSLYDTDDRVQWFIEHKKYEDAMALISKQGGSIPLLSVARLYINHLISLKEYDKAAKICLTQLGDNKALWEEEVFKFVKPQRLRSISRYLPTSDDSKLDPQVYEMVLYEHLKYDIDGFLRLIKEWPSHLYDCPAVILAIQSNFRKENADKFLEALAILHSYQKDYENSLRMYLKLQNKDVFELIRRYELYNVIHKMIIPLIQLDRERAFAILLDKTKIPSEIVVQQLEQNQELLYLYLDALDKVDSRGTFHWKLVNLYAKYEPKKLLPFLKRSNHYPIQEALDICKRELFYPEMVYLLGQMGNMVEALNIIIHMIKDIPMAIDFCKEHDDPELWNVLIDVSAENPDIMTRLLNGIVGYVNPEAIINKIKLGQRIPGLRKSLVKMLWDYRLQVKIQEASNRIQLLDYFNLHNEVVEEQRRAVCVSQEKSCEKCSRPIILKEYIARSDLIVFHCGHVYHEPCVPSRFGEIYCGSCKQQNDDDYDS